MNDKLKIILAFIFIANVCFSQQKGILLTSKTDDETEFYSENKRVRIETNDGQNYTGRIEIIDENTIAVDDVNILITSITKIRTQSVFSAILSTVHIVSGVIAVIGGVIAGGFAAIILVPAGVLFTGTGLTISAIGNNHKKYKWDYQVKLDYQAND